MKHTCFTILITLFLTTLDSKAASILAICSANSDLTSCRDSKLFFPVYRTTDGITTFNYRIDQGNLGDLSSAETVEITENLLGKWADESSLVFTRTGTGLLDSDINSDNYGPILEPSNPLGYSPVIWDADGDIIEDILGGGTKDYVLGFAGATCYNSSSIGTSCSGVSGDVNRIVESQTLLNGYLFNGDNTGDSPATILEDFKTTLLHEFAHMFGIDHTQGGDLESYDNSTGDYTAIPVMFPAAANPLEDLQQDDIASVRLAYPVGDEDTKFGKIRGTLTKSGNLIKGANIVAYKVGESNPRKLAVAAPSDSDGSDKFILPNLLPGTYILFAEPLDSSFKGGSSVGLHDPIKASKMTSGFYNGNNLAIIRSTDLDTGLARAEQVEVFAGETTDVLFETEATSPGSIDNGDAASFITGGRAFNETAIFLKTSKKKKVKAKLVNQTKGQQRSLTFSTDYPDLIQFKPEILNFNKRSRKVKIKLASYNDFVEIFPELDSFEEVTIPVTITDTTTGYVNNGNSLILF